MSSNKPKIALYLAGHMRTFSEYGKKNLQEFVKGHNVDIFVATHEYKDHSIMKKSDGTSYKGNNVKVSELFIRNMLDGLSVKKVSINSDKVDFTCVDCRTNLANYGLPRTDKKLENEGPYIPTHCHMCKSDLMKEFLDNCGIGMWRNVWRCHSMAKEYEKTHGFKYKYYIRSRPDLIYMEKIDFNNLPPLDKSIIIGFGGSLGYPDDQFAIAEEKVMDHYCGIRKVLDNWLIPHEVVQHTINKYPVCGHFNIGLVRFRKQPQPNKIIIQVDDDKWLMTYKRETFNIPGIPYQT